MNVYLPSSWFATQWPCDDWFHVPLKSEWDNLISYWTTLWAFSGGNFCTYLHIPKNWERARNNASVTDTTYWYYWSSSKNDNGERYFLFFNDWQYLETSSDWGTYWMNIRPFKNTPVIPDSNWTVEFQWTWTAGIYHDSTNWLISISSDWTTWITISDKNCWATEVYNRSSITQSNWWCFYQRWNNYWFALSWSLTTSTTRVDATWYWPWNYYSSSTFILTSSSPYNWDTSNNGNLRWWEDGNVNVTTMKEVQNIYIGDARPKTYTISWTEQSDMSSWWTYSDDATGLTAGSTEFDKFFGYYGCRLSSAWVETAKIDQSAPWILDITQLWTLTSWDNVMIAFPRLWIKMSKSWSVVTLSITQEPNKTWYQYYAHTKWSTAKDILYLWAYKMTSWYKSLSWQAPLVSQSRATFRSWVKSAYDNSAWTNRYSQITIYPRWFINALYMMKYGNPNSKSVIGKWYVWGTVANTGWTNSQTSASYWSFSDGVQAKLFWLEDWWWNVNEWMDWCYYNSSTQLTVDKTNNVFQDSDYSTNLWTASNWWLAWIDWSSDSMFRNINTSWWSSTTYYLTRSYSSASTVLTAGGSRSSWYADIWPLYVAGYSASYSAINFGSRLMYL